MQDGNIRIFQITPTVKNDHANWLVWWAENNIQQKEYFKTLEEAAAYVKVELL